MPKVFDIVLVTQAKYLHPEKKDWYIDQILLEDQLLTDALTAQGLKVGRESWDGSFDWSTTRSIVFRAIWDYFDRFDEFKPWLKRTESVTSVFNPPELIWWNIDKIYLKALSEKGIRIPPTVFLSKGSKPDLRAIMHEESWDKAVIKPNIAGAARNTFKVDAKRLEELTLKLWSLTMDQDMMVQQFQESITHKGEVSLMLFDGKYSHSVLKKAKAGDFRVQDDFGGSVHDYDADSSEIEFAETVLSKVTPLPAYARVDIMWNNEGDLCLSELEIIEPELWMRTRPEAAQEMAKALSMRLGEDFG